MNMRVPLKAGITMNRLQQVIYTLLVCVAASGCRGVTEERSAPGTPTIPTVGGNGETGTARTVLGRGETPPSASTALGSAVSEPQVEARGSFPLSSAEYRRDPELLEEAADILGSRIISVWPFAVGRVSNKVFLVMAENRKRGWFVRREGHYVRLDSGAELVGINDVLRDYRFTRQDFNDPAAVFQFLSDVTAWCGVGQGMPGSSYGLAMMTSRSTGLSPWLGGREKNEAALQELCRDPEFAFTGNTWRVRFNMFRPGGSVNEFMLVGRHDPEANANEILRIDVTTIRPPGTFSYPLGG
jgi:hypothetical protein